MDNMNTVQPFVPFTLADKESVPPFSMIEKSYNAQTFWGLSTAIDMAGCSVNIINSKEAITQYTYELCDLIKMKRYGEPQVVYFGDEERVEGYTLVQMIETSLISGHFTPYSGSAYIDIFSCSLYNPHDVAAFTQAFFKGSSLKLKVLFRG